MFSRIRATQHRARPRSQTRIHKPDAQAKGSEDLRLHRSLTRKRRGAKTFACASGLRPSEGGRRPSIAPKPDAQAKGNKTFACASGLRGGQEVDGGDPMTTPAKIEQAVQRITNRQSFLRDP